MPFSDVIGQDFGVSILQNSIRNSKLFHAYLFYGPTGVGKKLTAKIFAQAINCLQNSYDACGTCSSCKKIDREIHPDVRFIYPEMKDIKIAQMRDLNKEIYYRPIVGKYKVYILVDTERMNIYSANAILKTLEEPPLYSIIILITTSPNSLPETILSRVQMIKFTPLSDDNIKKIIKKYLDLSDDKLNLISSLSYGQVENAIRFKEELFLRRNNVVSVLTNISNQSISVIKASEELVNIVKDDKDRIGISEIHNLILIWYRDILMVKEKLPTDFITNQDTFSKLKKESEKFSTDDLLQIIYLIRETKDYILRNANIYLSLQVMLVRIFEYSN